jgi:hypothetical protein
MKHVDPDILAALKSLASGADSPRVAQARKRHDEATERRFETQMALLSDEVEAVVPKEHPLFELVLILVCARKVERSQQEPEFQSFVDEGFPNGW